MAQQALANTQTCHWEATFTDGFRHSEHPYPNATRWDRRQNFNQREQPGRALLTSVLFAGFVPNSQALALSGEPFAVREFEARMVD